MRARIVVTVGMVVCLLGVLICSQLALGAGAPPEKLVMLGHAVHQRAAEGLIEPFLEATGISHIEWRTFGLAGVRELLFREAALPKAPYNVGFLLNFWASPVITGLFEPLNEWLERSPIEGFPEDFSPGMIEALTIDGQIYGIPMRAVVSALHYNRAIFEERGVEVPRTIEELAEAAKRLTFTREDGTKVYGFAIEGLPTLIGDPLVVIARAWEGGGIITPDFRVVCNEPPMVAALTMIRDLFQAGAMPPNLLTLEVGDKIRMMQKGRVAMVLDPTARFAAYNDPRVSLVAGDVGVTMVPAAEAYVDILPGSRSLLNFWSFVIPRNAPDKEFAWELIRHLSTKDAQLYAALHNANTPTRLSVFAHPAYEKKIPYADIERKILEIAKVPWPAFDGLVEAQDIFGLKAHLAILGRMTPQQAMDDAARAIRALLAAENLGGY